jgi:hypothetical protein
VGGRDTAAPAFELIRPTESVAARLPHAPEPRRRWVRRSIYGLAGLLILAGIVALGYFPMSSARTHLLAGKRSLEQGKAYLLAGRPTRAERSFTAAQDSFLRASRALASPLLQLTRWTPIVGRTPDAVVAMARAGELVALAGQELAGAVEDLPGGLAALSPRHGAFPAGRLVSMAPAVRRAEEMVRSALEEVAGTSGSMLVGPVGEGRAQAVEDLGAAHETLETVAVLLDGLPGFLGNEGERRYFFAAENPAELRGTGGLIGAYAIVTMRDGGLEFSEFRPVQGLPNFGPDEIEPPSEEFARNYEPFGGAGFWLNVNMTPDFPSAAQAILASYRKATGQELDGVISADPFALAELLELTGPVKAEQYGIVVDAESVVAITANEAYRLFPDPAARKLALGEVAGTVFGRFLDKGGDVEWVGALAGAATDGHIQVYSTDPELQSALVRAGVAGAFGGPPGDFLSIVMNNAGGNKVDYFSSRAVTYSVQLESDGSAVAAADVELRNDAPLSGQPAYVIGPYAGTSERGESVGILTLYCAESCRVRSVERDGTAPEVRIGTELGYSYYQDYLRIPSKESSEVTFLLSIAEAWEGNSSGGTYRLTFVNQTTVRPTTLRLVIRAPDGMDIVSTSVPMDVAGSTATWEGIPGYRMALEISFRPPLLQRLGRNVARFLSKPVVELP